MSNNDIKELIDIAFGILMAFGSILWFILYHKLEKIYDELKGIRKEKKEVKHGEWETIDYGDEYDEYDGYDEYEFRCSICRSQYDMPFKTNFCPNCGADMRERKETSE